MHQPQTPTDQSSSHNLTHWESKIDGDTYPVANVQTPATQPVTFHQVGAYFLFVDFNIFSNKDAQGSAIHLPAHCRFLVIAYISCTAHLCYHCYHDNTDAVQSTSLRVPTWRCPDIISSGTSRGKFDSIHAHDSHPGSSMPSSVLWGIWAKFLQAE